MVSICFQSSVKLAHKVLQIWSLIAELIGQLEGCYGQVIPL